MAADRAFTFTSYTSRPIIHAIVDGYLRTHFFHHLRWLSLRLALRWKKKRPGMVVSLETGSDSSYHISPAEIKRERVLDLQTIVLLLTSIK